MKTRYTDDTALGPGHGFLRCSEDTFLGTDWTVTIQRATDRTYLSLEGEWLEPMTRFPLTGALSPDGTLSLPLAPSLVNALGTNDTYQIVLVSEDGETKKARLHIDSICYSTEQSLENAFVLPDEPKTVESHPEPSEEPVTESLVMPPPPREEGTDTPRWRSTRFLPLFLAACLLLGLVATYFALKDNGAQAQNATAALEAKTEEAQQAEAGKEAEASAGKQAEETKAAKAPSLEERVRGFFRSAERSGSSAAELARGIQASNAADQDALFRLYYFACENGDTSLLFEYAACFDPSKEAWGTIEKSAPEAWRLYEKAGQLDPERAQKAKEALKAWLVEQKEKGSAKAAQWLLELR